MTRYQYHVCRCLHVLFSVSVSVTAWRQDSSCRKWKFHAKDSNRSTRTRDQNKRDKTRDSNHVQQDFLDKYHRHCRSHSYCLSLYSLWWSLSLSCLSDLFLKIKEKNCRQQKETRKERVYHDKTRRRTTWLWTLEEETDLIQIQSHLSFPSPLDFMSFDSTSTCVHLLFLLLFLSLLVVLSFSCLEAAGPGDEMFRERVRQEKKKNHWSLSCQFL